MKIWKEIQYLVNNWGHSTLSALKYLTEEGKITREERLFVYKCIKKELKERIVFLSNEKFWTVSNQIEFTDEMYTMYTMNENFLHTLPESRLILRDKIQALQQMKTAYEEEDTHLGLCSIIRQEVYDNRITSSQYFFLRKVIYHELKNRILTEDVGRLWLFPLQSIQGRLQFIDELILIYTQGKDYLKNEK